MLRTTLCALVLGFACAAAAAEEARRPAPPPAERVEGLAVRGDGGQPLGRVAEALYDEEGRLVGVALAALEAPADAPPYLMRRQRPRGPALMAGAAGAGAGAAGRAPSR